MSNKIRSRGGNNIGKLIKAHESSNAVPAQKKKPIFSLHYLDKEYCISKCNRDEKTQLLDQLLLLSTMTWQEIDNAPRHGAGREKICRKAIRGKFPEHVRSDETISIFALRFSGKKAMAGYRQENIFHIIWVDRDFTLYNHG